MSRLFQFATLLALVVAAFVAALVGNDAPASTLISNGSFENTGSGWLSPWYFAVKSGGGGSVSQTGTTAAHGSYSALVNISNASATAPWLVQLSQSGLGLESGQTYTVSFAARADESRPLDIVLQQSPSPYTVRADSRVALSAAWQPFSFSYSATVSDPDISLHFNLAAATGNVWIDNVSVVPGSVTPSPVGSTTPVPSPSPSPTQIAGTTPLPTPSPTAAPPSVSSGKGIALRPFAEYWGSNTAGMNSDFDDMNAGDISWARMDLYKTASPNPAFDAAIQGAENHSINVIVVVHKTPPADDLGTEADRGAYRAWLAEMVNRYKHYVKYWEIQNEPNLHYEWNIDDSPGSNQAGYVASVQRYVSHLQDGFETVKGNDPEATVLFGGLSEWTVERYMDVLLTTEAYRYFDVMSFHPYGRDPDRVLSRFNSFKAKMNVNSNYAAKPIWITEIGFNTSWSNLAGYVSSEQQKADYLSQIMTRLPAAGAELPIFWYTLHENESASGFGLTRKDKTTLQTEYFPAFYAYRDTVLISAPASATPGSTPTPGPTPTATPALDSDGDGVSDTSDNCPNRPNPAQNLPPWLVPVDDADCDAFSATVEGSAGTSPLSHCGPDAWPADINNDRFSDITDTSALVASFGLSVPPGPSRQDIAPDTVDGLVDISDITRMAAFFGQTCD